MKKKSIIILLSLMMCLCCGLGLTACGHVHEEAVLPAVSPTCTTSGWTEGKWCAGCGEIFVAQEEIPATGHSKEEGQFVSDGVMHWPACINCDEGIREETANCSGGEATCSTRATCDVCKNEYGSTLEHNYSVFGSDGDVHWKKCSICNSEEPRSRTAHSGGEATCSQKKTCSVCAAEYGVLAAHDFSGDYFGDATGHYKECLKCQTKGEVKSHFGGKATCKTKAICDDCGLYYGSLAGHDYSQNVYHFDDDGHWRVCSECDYEDVDNITSHTGGRVNCQKRAVCEYCYQEYGDIGAHDFANGVYVYSEDGHQKQCAKCTVMSDKVPHTADVKNPATCTKQATCVDCKKLFGEMLEHDFENGIKTCDDAHHWTICKNCPAITTQEEHVQGTPADCVNAKVCEVCSLSYGEPLGHLVSEDWSDSNNTHHVHKCTRPGCQYVEGKEVHSGGKATCLSQAICETCGIAYGRTVSHDYDMSKYVAIDETYHAHKCKTPGCDEHDQLLSHYPNRPQATETERKECTTCGYVIEAEKNHEHVQAVSWSSDATYHWKGCTGCSEYIFEQTKVEHRYDGTCGITCLDCNYTRAVQHDFSDLGYDSYYHWTKCKKCGEASGSQTPHSGGEATCTQGAVCLSCNQTYEEALGHNFATSKVYGSDETHHWKKCSRCGEADTNKVAHNGTSTSCDQPATCTVCNKTYGEAGSHDFTNSTTYGTDATNHWKKCARCGADDTNKVAHKAGASAKCGEQAVCSTCNISYGSALAHDFTGAWKSNTTYHWRTCARTGCTGEDTGNKIKHSGGTATCQVQAKCSACNTSYGQKSDTHVFSTYNSNDNTHWGVCGCGYEDSANAVRHSGGTATCTTQAKCSTCSKAYGSYSGHVYTTKYKSDSSSHWQVCDKCSYENTGNKTSHSGGTATCQAQAKCSKCNTAYGSKGSHSLDTAVWGYTGSDGHARKCKTAGCTYTGSKSSHNFSEGNSEWMYGYCYGCGYVNVPANNKPNRLKHFGYFHTDGTNGGGDWTLTGARSWFKDIAELGNSDYVMLSNTNEPTYVAERLKEAKKYGLKAIGGIDLFEGANFNPRTANSAKLISNWESVLTNYINTIADYIKDGTFLGFMFDEPIWNGVKQSDFQTVTKKMRDLTINMAPGGRGVERLHCMCLAELGEYLGENNAWRVSAATNQYCTGVMYDVYSAWDSTVRTRYLNKLKSVATNNQDIWGCLDGIPGESQDVGKCQRNLIMQYQEALNEPRYAGIAVFTWDDGGDWTHGSKDYVDYNSSKYNANYRRVNIAIGKAVTGKGSVNGSADFFMKLNDPTTVYSKGASVTLAKGTATNGLGSGLSVSFKITTPSGKTSSVTAGSSYTLSESGNYAYTMTATNGSLTKTKTVYYSARDSHEISTYDTFAHNYDQHGTSDQVWCFAREVIQYASRSGLGCLRVKPHATDGSWMTIKVGYQDSTTYNLSSASYVSMWVYNTGDKALPGICLNASNGFSGNIATTSVNIPAKTWTEVKITKEQMTAKGLNLSKINLHINNSASFDYRPVFYIDDIMWYS